MRRLAPLGLMVALAACGEPEPPTAPAAAGFPSGPWSLHASGAAGTAVVLSDETGAVRLRIACRRNPAELHVEAPAFSRINSEERLTLGAGDELAVLAASPGTPDGAPVSAAGSIPGAFVDALESGLPIGAAYGASYLRDLPPLPARERRRFAAACREALGAAPQAE